MLHPIHKCHPSRNSSELYILLSLNLTSSSYGLKIYPFKDSFIGIRRSPCCCSTAVRRLAHKKLPLCHIEIQLKAPDKTLIKRLWKQMYPSCTRPYNLPNAGSAESPEGVNSAGSGLLQKYLTASNTQSWRQMETWEGMARFLVN